MRVKKAVKSRNYVLIQFPKLNVLRSAGERNIFSFVRKMDRKSKVLLVRTGIKIRKTLFGYGGMRWANGLEAWGMGDAWVITKQKTCFEWSNEVKWKRLASACDAFRPISNEFDNVCWEQKDKNTINCR